MMASVCKIGNHRYAGSPPTMQFRRVRQSCHRHCYRVISRGRRQNPGRRGYRLGCFLKFPRFNSVSILGRSATILCDGSVPLQPVTEG